MVVTKLGCFLRAPKGIGHAVRNTSSHRCDMIFRGYRCHICLQDEHQTREVKKGKSKEGTRNTNPPVFNLLFDFCFVPTVATPSQTQNVQILLEFRETILS